MKFLNPWAFLLLAAAPLLVLLYFLKLKRPRISVASTLLWQKVVEDMRVNSPFQRLKRSLLLFLQLLALLAAIVALARPLANVEESVERSVIVLLDNSASMSAREPDGKTRLDIARSEIYRTVDELAKDDELMVISFNVKAAVACGFTGDRRRLKEVVAGIEPTDCPTVVGPAFVLAKSIADSRAHPRVLIFSDGAFTAPEDVDLPAEIVYRKVGTVRPNIAITGLDLRRSLNDRSRIEMFVAVENFSQENFAGNMAVSLDDAVLDSKYVSVGPGETLSQIFETDLLVGGNISVKFDAHDALVCDNQAWKVAPAPVPRRVLVVGDDTFFVERAFNASVGMEYKCVRAADYSDGDAAGFSTVIWSGVSNPRVASCNNIYLGCVPAIEGLAVGGKIEAPEIMDWDNVHPVNRFLDYDNLVIASTMALTLPPHARTILRSPGTPLIGMIESDGGNVCVIGFAPMESNWPLLLSFPLFLNGCLDYFDERQSGRIEINIPVGKTITLPPASAVPAIALPSGERRQMARNQSGELSFAGVDRCGIYRVAMQAGGTISIAANLFDREESKLEPSETVTLGRKTIKAVADRKQMNREYWRYLVMAIGLVLLIEWIVYHRRLFV